MINYAFSIYDLEYFLLILVRVSCFVFIAPFFSMSNTPRRIRAAFSICTALLLYQALTPGEVVAYETTLEYAVIVVKEAVTGLLIGFSANVCTAVVNFAGSIADMETGLSMVTLMDPTTRENTSITGVLYQYVLMMMLIASGMYRYLFGALADYVMLGFRIVLPIFCVILLLNAVLGILAKVSPQMNMFAVGMQLKILVGLSVLFLTAGMLPGMADMVFQEIRDLTAAFVGAMR